MKRLFLLLNIIILPILMFAHDIIVDGIYYKYGQKTATVTYRGGYSSAYSSEYKGNITVPETIIYNDKEYTVTTVDAGTFQGCTELKSIILPNTIKVIGESAFSGCTSLESVVLPDSIDIINKELFYNCSKLPSIKIPEKIDSIAPSAFENCSTLSSLIIPSNVKTISNSCFYGCKNLETVILPDSIYLIGTSAFERCNALKNINVPYITTIENYAFRQCSSLENIVLPESLLHIGEEAFSWTGLQSVVLTKSLNYIGAYAFKRTSIKKVIFETQSSIQVYEHSYPFEATEIDTIYWDIPNSSISSDILGYIFETVDVNISDIIISNIVETIPDDIWSIFNLYRVTSHSTTPPTILTENTFSVDTYNNATLFVPKGSVEAYKNSEYWKNFYNIYENPSSEPPMLTLSIEYPEGSVVKIKEEYNVSQVLNIAPVGGWYINTVTFNEENVTEDVDTDGNYVTPILTEDSRLSIVLAQYIYPSGTTTPAEKTTIKVFSSNNIITIEGADINSEVLIYDAWGYNIYSGIEKQINISLSGIYIVVVEGQTFKLII